VLLNVESLVNSWVELVDLKENHLLWNATLDLQKFRVFGWKFLSTRVELFDPV